jgi:hypothetical protein
MTRIQIISLIAIAGAAAWSYFPRSMLRIPTVKPKGPDVLGHMRSVMEIRNTYTSSEVQTAATALLQALLNAK